MNVRLIALTQPVDIEEFDQATAEAIQIYIARVSSRRKDKFDDIEGLLQYLVDNNHWSPFEMANMVVEIVTSRAISLQIVRHRSFSYQQFSQRYAASADMEPIQLRLQAEKNRQSSTDVIAGEIVPTWSDIEDPLEKLTASTKHLADRVWHYHAHRSDRISWSAIIGIFLQVAQDLYKLQLDRNVAKECARMILPETTQTRMYMNGTIRSWIHYLWIRDDPHVQKEHRDIAKEIKVIFCEKFPLTSAALGWFLTDDWVPTSYKEKVARQMALANELLDEILDEEREVNSGRSIRLDCVLPTDQHHRLMAYADNTNQDPADIVRAALQNYI